MTYTSEQITRYETNQKGTLQVSLFTQVSRLILKLSNRDNMEKLKEYIYIYSGTFKEEGEGRNHFPFSYFDRFHGCKKLKHRKIAKWSTGEGVEKFRGGKRRKFVSTVALNLAVAYEIFIILDMKVRPVNGGFPSTRRGPRLLK